MKRRILVALALLFVCLSVVGCGAPANALPSATSETSVATTEATAQTEPADNSDTAKKKASYDAKLSSYVDLVLTLGVALKENDELIVEGNIENYEIMNQIALRAYERGAKLVFLDYRNKFLDNANAKYLTEEGYLAYPYLPEIFARMVGATREKAKTIELHDYYFEEQTGASEQELNEYSTKINDAKQETLTPKMEILTQLGDFNNPNHSIYAKTVAAVPSKIWAKKVYPDLDEQSAFYQLADDIFGFVYATEEGSTMVEHLQEIAKRRDKFNEMEIVSLHYASATVDLDVPLHKNNVFASMPNEKNGDVLAGNIPSEEIFGLPTKFGANGTVQNTRPLIFNGSQVIDGIKLEFKDGKLINYSVKENPEAFEAIMKQMPEGVYLGEISMVSSDSPIFQSGKVYYSTLIDENAAAHMAIGTALGGINLKEGTEADEDVNSAVDHHDIVIGSEDLTVTATLKDGSKVELLKDGVWAN